MTTVSAIRSHASERRPAAPHLPPLTKQPAANGMPIHGGNVWNFSARHGAPGAPVSSVPSFCRYAQDSLYGSTKVIEVYEVRLRSPLGHVVCKGQFLAIVE